MNFNSEVYNKLVDCKNWSDLEATGYTPHLDPTYSAYMKHIYDKNQQQQGQIREQKNKIHEQDDKIKELTQEIFKLKEKPGFDEEPYLLKFKVAEDKINKILGSTEIERVNKRIFLKSIEISGDLYHKSNENILAVPEEVFDVIAPNEKEICVLLPTEKFILYKTQSKAFDVIKKKAEEGEKDFKLALAHYYLGIYQCGLSRYIEYKKSKGEDLNLYQSPIDPQKLLDQANEQMDNL